MRKRSGRRDAPVITRERAEAIVSRSGWLADRPTDFREKILAKCRPLTFAKGDVIYRIGDPPNGIYGLVKGLLRIEVLVGDVGEQLAFIARSGFWIGVAAAMHRHERKVTLISAEDSSLLYLPLKAFDELSADTENTRHFASLINENNDIAMAVARDLMNPDVHARIASRLLSIFGRADSAVGSGVSITQADLATLCNVSRKTVNQELAQLEKSGAITRAYGRLVLNDLARLENVAAAAPNPAPASSGSTQPDTTANEAVSIK